MEPILPRNLNEGQTDDQPSQKPYRQILKDEIIAGLVELNRPCGSLFLSSLSAGLELGFSLLLMGVMLTLVSDVYEPPITRILMANMYSLGFILVILGRSELFTEHTTLAVLPLLDGKSSIGQVLRLWAVVFAGNIVGSAAMAGMIYGVASPLLAIEPWALEEIATDLVNHQWWVILFSAMFAGWLMGQLAWVSAAARDTISQIVFVWLITTAIGLAGLHHVVIGTAEVVAGLLASEQVTFLDFGRFLLWATLGNALGGVLFVSIIKYGHASSSSGQISEADK